MLLIFSLAAGFMFLVTSGQQMTGLSNGQTRAFYGAEAGMEKLTADLGTLFDNTYSPSATQLNQIPLNPPALPGIKFLATDGTSGYKLDYPKDNQGKPLATNQTIKSGPWGGMLGLITPYTLTVTGRTESNNEVMLRRTTQTVAIPAFQFGIFCGVDCSFHAGPDFNFGGRVHTNRNLYLAEGSGGTLTLSDKVTAYNEIFRTNIANGQPLSANNWTGTVNVNTTAGYRSLGTTEGSAMYTGYLQNGGLSCVGQICTHLYPENAGWAAISQTSYNSNMINYSTGVTQKLQLPIEVLSNGQASPVDLLRRPTQGEAGNPDVLGERYFAQASMKILLSDQAQDIMQLPCVDPNTQPVDLSTLAVSNTAPVSYYATDALGSSVTDPTTRLPIWYLNGNPTAVPLATSAAGNAKASWNAAAIAGYTSTPNGYWLPKYEPTITGYLKIEIQIGYLSPCGKWQDVTQEILKLGLAGRNQNPGLSLTTAAQLSPAVPLLPGVGVPVGASTCADPHPNAVIRLEHIRDNPSNALAAGVGTCGVNLLTIPAKIPTLSTDYWPNVLFDAREGAFRDVCPNGSSPCTSTQPMVNGVIHYVELDVNNLAKWFTGQLGINGPGAMDGQNAPYDFVVYFSDRRGNYLPTSTTVGAWPPLSPSKNETGEYGFSDFINPGDAANACPDGLLNAGEDVSESGIYYNYGQKLSTAPFPFGLPTRLFTDAQANALAPNPKCAVPSTPWPGYYIKNPQEARMNPPLFFRRALKLVNASNINAPLSAKPCPGGLVCGLNIASENPVYIQGDYNANSAGNGLNDPHVAAAVLADSVTFLSGNWNDINSFATPYNPSGRPAKSTYYRTAVLAGKGQAFPWPGGTNAPDIGSDGGVHNFLRYLESWSGASLFYRGSIVSLFYSRQATGIYKCCATVYSAPTRGYNFDVEFLEPSKLPPRTPMFRSINTTGFTQLIYPEQK